MPKSKKSFKCSCCNIRFSTKYSMDRHIRLKKNRTQNYKCPHCGVECGGAIFLERHLNQHTEIYKFKCNDCGKRFMDQKKLNCHLPHCTKNREITNRVKIFKSAEEEEDTRSFPPVAGEQEKQDTLDGISQEISSQSNFNPAFTMAKEQLDLSPKPGFSFPQLDGAVSGAQLLAGAKDLMTGDLSCQVSSIMGKNHQLSMSGLPYSLNQISQQLNSDNLFPSMVSLAPLRSVRHL